MHVGRKKRVGQGRGDLRQSKATYQVSRGSFALHDNIAKFLQRPTHNKGTYRDTNNTCNGQTQETKRVTGRHDTCLEETTNGTTTRLLKNKT